MNETLAETRGFEPLDDRSSLVFKTSAFGRSATSPVLHTPMCVQRVLILTHHTTIAGAHPCFTRYR
jgi:hypothetical protein